VCAVGNGRRADSHTALHLQVLERVGDRELSSAIDSLSLAPSGRAADSASGNVGDDGLQSDVPAGLRPLALALAGTGGGDWNQQGASAAAPVLAGTKSEGAKGTDEGNDAVAVEFQLLREQHRLRRSQNSISVQSLGTNGLGPPRGSEYVAEAAEPEQWSRSARATLAASASAPELKASAPGAAAKGRSKLLFSFGSDGLDVAGAEGDDGGGFWRPAGSLVSASADAGAYHKVKPSASTSALAAGPRAADAPLRPRAGAGAGGAGPAVRGAWHEDLVRSVEASMRFVAPAELEPAVTREPGGAARRRIDAARYFLGVG
jgi:hypothetical protein